MQRRDFVKKTSILTLGLGLGTALGYANIKQWYRDEKKPLSVSGLANVSDNMESSFRELINWLRTNGWGAYLNQALGVNLDLDGEELKKELIKEIDRNKLAALRQNEALGFDDFSGERLILPGFPAYSLLFHTMASPRVRPDAVKEYPSLTQVDLMENYIYALSNWEQLRSMYRSYANDDLVFAVFAYEYRPAFKTPHHAHADMVYSRTGIARIGNEPLHYDRVNRCHTAKPEDENKIKHVAVMPARYGLFLARKVKHNNLSMVRAEIHKGNDSKDDRYDANKFFLQPIRKVFNDDELTGNMQIRFSEMHKSEKLEKLSLTKGITMKSLKPKPRFSKDLVVQDENKRHAGSSFLVISQPNDLIRPARENGQILFFKVPKFVEKPYPNRYFTAFCTQEVEDVELLEGSLHRIYNHYEAPRNQPLFVNITNKVTQDTAYTKLEKTRDQGFEKEMKKGNYYAPLFEDSICDGSVTVDMSGLTPGDLDGVNKKCLPAFSVVTAPDFFPQVDPLDFGMYDISPGSAKKES
ncbi:MAG TPA: hypothetical protein VHL77_02335, partial [Ferruginibacter sp.]|nr:hypothetical protein [Ferruginibacter sp.]